MATESREYPTELDAPSRIAYRSVIDFVPDHEPFERLTVVDLTPVEGSTRVVILVEELHDEARTERLLAGRANELENLARVVA